jgi:phosphate uptake regulator
MPLSKSFSRLTRTVGHMLDDLAQGIRGGDRGLLEELPARDDIVDKLFIFVWRQVFLVLSGRRLARELGARSLGDAVLVMTAAKHLERISDHASAIAEEAAGGSLGDCREEIAGKVEAAVEAYHEAVRVFSSPERRRCEEAMRRCLALRGSVGSGGLRCSGGSGLGLYTVLHGVRRIVDYTTDIVELAMNRLAVWRLEEPTSPGRGGE